MLATIQSGAYKFVLVLHIVTAIFGFGAVVLNGVYARLAMKARGAEGLAISEANYAVTMIGEKLIYLVPLLGIGLVGMSDKVWSFGQAWIWLALVLYVVALGASHAVLIPSHHRINELSRQLVSMGPPGVGAEMTGPPPQVAEIEALGRRMAPVGASLDVILVVIVALMVWKPGA